jgi:hypothetical protein
MGERSSETLLLSLDKPRNFPRRFDSRLSAGLVHTAEAQILGEYTETYTARLSPADHYNSNGVRLQSAAANDCPEGPLIFGGNVLDMAGRKAPARTEPRPTLPRPAPPYLLYAISPIRFALFWASARRVSTKPPASSQAERPPFKEKTFRYPIFWRLSAAKAARLPAAQ